MIVFNLSDHYLSEAVRKEISPKSKAELIVENWSVFGFFGRL